MNFLKKIGNFLISRAFLINLVLIIIFWVVLIWLTLKYFDNYTKREEKIAVPTLITNNISDVPALIADRDIRYEIIDSIYNPNLVEGTIIYQDPMPTDSTGIHVKSGRSIKLRVSKQTRLVEVPIVISKSRRFAEATLNSKSLRTKTTFVPSNEDQGSVIEQKINGQPITKNIMVPINSVVELVVGQRTGSELTAVPNLFGLTINEAEERLKGNQSLRLFAVCSSCKNAQDSLTARIERQTPTGGEGSSTTVGSTITVFATTDFSE